jgi:hypothetical protein
MTPISRDWALLIGRYALVRFHVRDGIKLAA